MFLVMCFVGHSLRRPYEVLREQILQNSLFSRCLGILENWALSFSFLMSHRSIRNEDNENNGKICGTCRTHCSLARAWKLLVPANLQISAPLNAVRPTKLQRRGLKKITS